MGDSGDLWRAYSDQAKEWKDEKEPFRLARLGEMLTICPEIIVLRRLGPYGWRLMHYEWPQRQYVDFWPRTSKIRYQGKSHKGWVKLVKILGVYEKWKKRIPLEPNKET